MGIDTNGFLIHVTLHDVSVQTTAHQHRAFYIDIIAHFQQVKVRQPQRLLHCGDRIEITLDLHHRQAHTVVRDGLIYTQRFPERVAKREVFIRLLGLNLYDLSHGFYNS